MIDRFKDFLQTYIGNYRECHFLLAISGGVDSMTLLDLCQKAELKYGIAHVNYDLRGQDSDADENLVKKTAAEHKVDCFIERVDTKKYAIKHKQSTQMAARTIRYQFFNRILSSHSYHFLLTAHHNDDSAETVLLNLINGTSLKGLKGIPKVNDRVLRPLSSFSRAEIKKWAEDHAVIWREDKSNASNQYDRNLIRNELIPIILKINPSWLSTLEDTKERLEAQLELSEMTANSLSKSIFTESENRMEVSLIKWRELGELKARFLLWQKIQEYGFNYRQTKDIWENGRGHSGAEYHSNSHILIQDREKLFVEEKENHSEVTVIDQLEGETKISWIGQEFVFMIEPKSESWSPSEDSETVELGLEKLDFPLEMGSWRTGETFNPMGMKGKKKLSDEFIDKKIPIHLKNQIPILRSRDRVVAILTDRIDDRFKVTKSTKTILRITKK